jgi:hypothetical protein
MAFLPAQCFPATGPSLLQRIEKFGRFVLCSLECCGPTCAGGTSLKFSGDELPDSFSPYVTCSIQTSFSKQNL